MALPRRSPEAALAALVLLLAAPVRAEAPALAGAESASESERPALAVMGTVPLFWGEAADLGEILGGGYRTHWARGQLEKSWRIEPLDFLDAAALAGRERLLLAQPRGLAPEENVALDAWVRGGGHLLLFVDPMMTGQSRFAIGDRRRPQDVALLSPILAHWGLALEFDQAQPAGPQRREIAGRTVPLDLPGRLSALPDAGGEPSSAAARCTFEAAVLADCVLGEGRVVILADAALLDIAGPWDGAPAALERLLALAFADRGDFAGDSAFPADPTSDVLGKQVFSEETPEDDL